MKLVDSTDVICSATLMNLAIEPIMQQCIKIAQENQTPFGAALINDKGEILELACNTTRNDGPVAHAEVNVMRHANKYPNDTLYLVTTCEPCPMCAGAAIWAKVEGIYFGASIADASQFMKQIVITCQQVVDASWKKIPVKGGILREACIALF